MDIWDSKSFDMPLLLRQGDFNIRRVADMDQSLTVGEYFDMLAECLTLAPEVGNAIIKFENKNGDRDAYKSLDDMISLLEKMGCGAFIVEFHSIADAYTIGNWRLAATHAKNVTESFSSFRARLMEAVASDADRGTGSSANAGTGAATNAGSGSAANAGAGSAANMGSGLSANVGSALIYDLSMTLVEYLKRLDEEENNRKLLIAIVDDSPTILKAVAGVLSDTYNVLTVVKPKMLEKLLRQRTPELFILDCNMPELSGYELVPIIRSFEEHKDTPIIFLTSDRSIDNISSARLIGIDEFVAKPVDPSILREKIAKHIVRKKAS